MVGHSLQGNHSSASRHFRHGCWKVYRTPCTIIQCGYSSRELGNWSTSDYQQTLNWISRSVISSKLYATSAWLRPWDSFGGWRSACHVRPYRYPLALKDESGCCAATWDYTAKHIPLRLTGVVGIQEKRHMALLRWLSVPQCFHCGNSFPYIILVF